MKAHKYWSLGALACMAGCFLHRLQKTAAGSQIFCLRLSGLHGYGDLLRPQKLHPKEEKKLKKKVIIYEQHPSLCTYTAVRDFYFHYKLYGTNRTYFMTSIMSLIPTFMPSSKAVFSHAQHTLPCWSMIFSQSGMSIP